MRFSYTSPAGYHLATVTLHNVIALASFSSEGWKTGSFHEHWISESKMQASCMLHCTAAPGGSKDSGLWPSVGWLFVRLVGAEAEEVCGEAAVVFKLLRCMTRWIPCTLWPLYQQAQFRWKQRKYGCISKCEMRFGSSLNPAEILGSRWLLPMILFR